MTRDIVARFDRDFDLLVTPTMTIEPPAVGLSRGGPCRGRRHR